EEGPFAAATGRAASVAAGPRAPLDAAVGQGAVDLVLHAGGLRRGVVVDRRWRWGIARLRQGAAHDHRSADDAGAEEDFVAVVSVVVPVMAMMMPVGVVLLVSVLVMAAVMAAIDVIAGVPAVAVAAAGLGRQGARQHESGGERGGK